MKPSGKFLYRMQQFMRGRYGQNDTLNRVLTNTALLLLVISIFSRINWLTLIALLLLAISYWRLFSKKIYQQVAINRGFQAGWYRLVKPITWTSYQLKQHWQFRFFHCSQCHQRIRIPRHHGRVRITCPKCGNRFEART
ncbi:Zn-Finger Containing protein [Lactiplantibacillus daowaiensis]|uniref:Zn-Finger Containing protein n=1 Tax=Lactiplantibacillus daowaiensis TaxID=2559918 RepID=A0ABW1S1S0_9LACO|nr:Zn-Finger Containing protein [Lactiplantibacillus daowaiensis]